MPFREADSYFGSTPFVLEDFRELEQLNDIAHKQVSDVFSDYCSVFGIPVAYGVERFELGGTALHITQDTSCRGCYDCASHQLQLNWLTMSPEDRLEDMQQVKARQDRQAQKRKADADKAEIARLEGRLRVLRGETA